MRILVLFAIIKINGSKPLQRLPVYKKHSRISVYKTDSIYKEIHQLVPWTKGWQSYEKSYSGDDETIRKALTSVQELRRMIRRKWS